MAHNILRSIHMKSLSFSISKLINHKKSETETNHIQNISINLNNNQLQPLLLPNPPKLIENDDDNKNNNNSPSSLMRLPSSSSSKTFKKPQIRIKQTARRGKKRVIGSNSNSRSNALPSFKPSNNIKHTISKTIPSQKNNKPINAEHDFFHKIGSSTSPPAILKDVMMERESEHLLEVHPESDHLVIIPSDKERERERRKKRMIELQQHILRKERMESQNNTNPIPMSWGSNIYSFGDNESIPIPLNKFTFTDNMFEEYENEKKEKKDVSMNSGEALLQKWGISSFKRVSEVPCSNCSKIVKSGYRHICKHPQCNNFVLCPECHEDLTESERQQIHGGPWHPPHRPMCIKCALNVKSLKKKN